MALDAPIVVPRSWVMNRIAIRFAFLLAAAAVLPLLAYGAMSVYSLRSGAQRAVA